MCCTVPYYCNSYRSENVWHLLIVLADNVTLTNATILFIASLHVHCESKLYCRRE